MPAGHIELRRYVDVDRLVLYPIEGEDGWYWDSSTFRQSNGQLFHLLLMTDKKGVYVPDPIPGITYPRHLDHYVIEYRMICIVQILHAMEISRSRDPRRSEWSVNVSRLDKDLYKITIDAFSPRIVHRLLERLTSGTYFSWLTHRRRATRAYRERRRNRRPQPYSGRTKGHYTRPTTAELAQMIERQLALSA